MQTSLIRMAVEPLLNNGQRMPMQLTLDKLFTTPIETAGAVAGQPNEVLAGVMERVIIHKAGNGALSLRMKARGHHGNTPPDQQQSSSSHGRSSSDSLE